MTTKPFNLPKAACLPVLCSQQNKTDGNLNLAVYQAERLPLLSLVPSFSRKKKINQTSLKRQEERKENKKERRKKRKRKEKKKNKEKQSNKKEKKKEKKKKKRTETRKKETKEKKDQTDQQNE
jgi:hypothetical protein